MIKAVSQYIKDEITSAGKPEKAKWLENYIKHGIKSKGVGIPEIRKIIHEINQKHQVLSWPILEQMELLNDLMSSDYTEDKLAAILYIQLYWKNVDEQAILQLISNWFDSSLIFDWNVCDWLCVRILSLLVDTRPDYTINELRKWNKNSYLWKARASLVPFAQCKTIKQHKKLIEEFSVELIQREERFCKTAVGWILREYSKIDKNFVSTFLQKHEKWITNEVVRNATKYM